jgi:transcription termination factor Rho
VHSNGESPSPGPGEIPFGAMELPQSTESERSSSQAQAGNGQGGEQSSQVGRQVHQGERQGDQGGGGGQGEHSRDWRRPENRRGRGRRGGRRRHMREERRQQYGEPNAGPANDDTNESRELGAATAELEPTSGTELSNTPPSGGDGGYQRESRFGRRRRRGRRGQRGLNDGERNGTAVAQPPAYEPRAPSYEQHQKAYEPRQKAEEVFEGMFLLDKGGNGVLRRLESQYLPGKQDVWVPQRLVARCKLRDGSLVSGPVVRGQGQYKLALAEVERVDGRDPREVANLAAFKHLTSIDPDFHYAVGDISGDVSMRVLDVICPVGRGTRGLIVAPPRSGKTILRRKFAAAIEQGYPDVKLMVLLVDERPEEATEWRRSTGGQVFVSTNDESARNHVNLAEAVWKRCQRLVELGDDVVLMLDSITRLARAYNNLEGGSGRTLSGGLDSRAMERPRAIFGSARNTETAGSLTILGTTLVETGSRLDQLVFEEFKGTGNSECVLSRKLADRRIFPSIDVERSGTRKEEKLYSARRLRQIATLRRVLLKMNFIEAMELLITKLDEVDKIDDFLKRFDVDPEA